ncbi:MAG: DUF2807 domain-containing protein [Bacteroidales bacterium]|jgi:hypothetical protein|nr:DUF2807 domain-containing protein [Bacteroidales bacterium]
MKKIVLSLLCLVLLFVTDTYAKKVKGDGKVVTQIRNVSSFEKIEVSGVFNIILEQGETEKIKIETDQNLLEYVITEVVNNKLKIYTPDDITIEDPKKGNIYITIKDINEISMEGVGNIKTSGQIKVPGLKIYNVGVGSVDVDVVTDVLNVNFEGVGSCNLSGNTKNLDIKSSGLGGVDAKKLTADIVSVENSSVGNISVYARKELSLDNSGIGNITYYGDAEIKSLNDSGIGKIKKGK